MVGNDALSSNPGKGILGSSIELYEIENLPNCVILQVRSPVLEGHRVFFCEELKEFIKSCGFARVVVLAGANSGLQKNPQKAHDLKIHYWSDDDNNNKKYNEDYGWTCLENPLNLVQAGILKSLRECLKNDDDDGVEFLGLVLFCKGEGNNNVVDGVNLALGLNKLLASSSSPSFSETWKLPQFWNSIMGLNYSKEPSSLLY